MDFVQSLSDEIANETVQCDQTQFNLALDRCAFVSNYCETESLINFYHIYYCLMDESLLYLPIGVLPLFIPQSNIVLGDSVVLPPAGNDSLELLVALSDDPLRQVEATRKLGRRNPSFLRKWSSRSLCCF